MVLSSKLCFSLASGLISDAVNLDDMDNLFGRFGRFRAPTAERS